MVVLLFTFLRNLHRFPQWLPQFTFPPTVKDSLFSLSLPAFVVCRLFDDGHSDRYGVISHCCFDLHFSNNCIHTQSSTLLFHLAEKAMAPHSSTLAWKIPWMEEPGRLQSMGSLRVGHDSATSLSFFTFMHWRRKWQPTPVFFPGESQGQGSLVGCRLWGRTEWDTTEVTQQQRRSIWSLHGCLTERISIISELENLSLRNELKTTNFILGLLRNIGSIFLVC